MPNQRQLRALAGATIATIALVVYLLLVRQPLQRLIDAATRAPHRAVHARLTGFPHAPLPSVTRGEDSLPLPPIAKLRELASKIVQSDDDDAHTSAIARLLAGDSQAAIDVLEAAVAREPRNATLWTDLSAARYEEARRLDAPELFAAAIDAADRALELERTSEALFDRALALDALRIAPAAERAYRAFLVADGTSKWADEARQRLRELERPTMADEWKASMPKLERACLDGDAATASTIVRSYPSQARRQAEGIYLGAWGEAELAGDSKAAREKLTIARCVGAELRSFVGEHLLADAVAAIDRGDVTHLARAHVVYGAGRAAYAARNVAVGAAKLGEAERLFRAATSPMALLAAYYRANAASDLQQLQAALQMLDGVVAAAPPTYLVLQGDVQWLRALIVRRLGRLDATVDALHRAADAYDRGAELSSAIRMKNEIASMLALLGRSTDAWRMRRDAFAAASTLGNAMVFDRVLATAADDELADEQWASAAVLFDAQTKLFGVNAVSRANAVIRRTFARARAGRAPGGFGEAHLAVSEISDPAMRANPLDAIREAEATLAVGTDPRRALQLLSATIEQRKNENRTKDLPHAYLGRARAHRALGHVQAAIDDVEAAIAIFDGERSSIEHHTFRDTFYGKTADAFAQLVDLYTIRGDYDRAFIAAEKGRARIVAERTGVTRDTTPDDVANRLAPRSTLIHYTTLADRKIAFVIRKGAAMQTVTHRIPREELARLGGTLIASMERDDRATARASAERLYDALVRPLQPFLSDTETLVIVPDDVLAEVPFAALVDRATDRYFFEQHELAIAPNAGSWRRRTNAPPSTPATAVRALLVGDPAFDRSLFPKLERLDGARDEVTRLASLYTTPIALADARATKLRIVEEIPLADLIHIGAHAFVNRRDPWLSMIALAPAGGDGGRLYLAEIAQLRLERAPLVVLAGCRTAAAGAGRGSIRSLSMAFLAGGSRSVIGTLWNVDDAATRELSVRLHRHLREGLSPAAALRRAQLAMLRSSETALANPRAWSGFQVYATE